MNNNIDTLRKLILNSDSYHYTIDKESLTKEEITSLIKERFIADSDNLIRIYEVDSKLIAEKTTKECCNVLDKIIGSTARAATTTNKGLITQFIENYSIKQGYVETITYNGYIVELSLTNKLSIKIMSTASTFVKYAKSKATGIILINENSKILNLHIKSMVDNMCSNHITIDKKDNTITDETDAPVVILRNFNYAEDYELIADLISQNKIVIVVLNKYNNERIISAFVSKLPVYLKNTIVENLIGSYIYYNIKSQHILRHSFVAAMHNLKADIFQDNFSDKTIQMANQLFNTETKMMLGKDTTVEDLPAEVYLRKIVASAKAQGASDISLSVGQPPLIRVNNSLIPIEIVDKPEDETILSVKLGPNTMAKFTENILDTKDQKDKFNTKNQVDTAYSLTGNDEGSGRFRVSIYKQRNSISMSLRILKRMDDKTSDDRALSLKECGVPDHVVSKLDNTSKGIIIFTGPVNTGKSTIMNAIIDHFNSTRYSKIIAIEDPIEILHASRKCLIEQREVGIDCDSFEDGLKQALRSDPDIINIAEIRTLEAARAALMIARSGHLVMTTFHTPDATQTINGILQLFPEGERLNIKNILKDELVMIYSQQLLDSVRGGMVPAQEILFNTTAFKGEISKEAYNFTNIILNNQREGMRSMDKTIADLYVAGKITKETALLAAHKKEDLEQFINASNTR